MALPQKVYVTDHHRLAEAMDTTFPRTAFAGATLDRLFTGDAIDALDAQAREAVLAFNADFITCDCDGRPYCGHPEEAFCRWVLDTRLDGLDPEGIVDEMGQRYHLYAYPGDVVNFLDDAIRRLEALADLAAVEGEATYSDRTTAVRRALEAGAQPS